MTRINCVPPSELADKHLLAEYRELPRIAKLAFSKSLNNPRFKAGPQYTMGKGHVMFFIDKGLYLKNRFSDIVSEMLTRGFKPNFTQYPDIHPAKWMGDWVPDDIAMAINRERINLRLNEMAERKAKHEKI